MHRYFSRISWASAVHVDANGHCLRSLSIEATYTFEFLGEHVQLSKQSAVEKLTNKKAKKSMDTSRANISMVG